MQVGAWKDFDEFWSSGAQLIWTTNSRSELTLSSPGQAGIGGRGPFVVGITKKVENGTSGVTS